jgi:predicted acylesterase/phospholipase RssA
VKQIEGKDNPKVAALGVDFNDIFHSEISVINDRRKFKRSNFTEVELKEVIRDSTGQRVFGPNEDANLVGLALSGGGIRSSAFCLGVLQALNKANILDHIDYLSTVSGGGYIGCSLSTCLESAKGTFPFDTKVSQDGTPSLRHIRDHENYLIPNGAFDVLISILIYLRGLFTNLALFLSVLLVAAAFTVFTNPTVGDLQRTSLLSSSPLNLVGLKYFVVTSNLSAMLLAVFIVWGLKQSFGKAQDRSEIQSVMPAIVGGAVLIVCASAICELQPFVLAGMFEPKLNTSIPSGISWRGASLTSLASVASLTLYTVLVVFFGREIRKLIKAARQSSNVKSAISGLAAKSVTGLAIIGIIFLLWTFWTIYLRLAYWGICINSPADECYAPALPGYGYLAHLFDSPRWGPPIAILYLLVGSLFLLLTIFQNPNANSLHPLYRDRLAKAFLFKPRDTLPENEDLEPYPVLLSGLSGKYGPYHIINTALNIQGSKLANKRGRNADLFSFSQNFVGSKTTRYVPTSEIDELELATAMAASGAAASSNMGVQSIRPLTPILAILNIRLGCWLPNPRRLAHGSKRTLFGGLYLFAEFLGWINERKKSVYLTDGGHIENLGIYELLRRRCRVIIAVDAEADPEMEFSSYKELTNYAKIDFQAEIDLPWQGISKVSLNVDKSIEGKAEVPKLKGPHCAIGKITYLGGQAGVLVYIKSSLTGDETDRTLYYKKKHLRFPHETTLDQFFGEDQFEAYRDLGFHSADGLFSRRDDFAKLEVAEYPDIRVLVGLMDQLFPPVATERPAGRRQHFSDWLPAES